MFFITFHLTTGEAKTFPVVGELVEAIFSPDFGKTIEEFTELLGGEKNVESWVASEQAP